MITAIDINNDDFDGFQVSNDSGLLSGLNQINTFIGVNNSGKSRFIRTLFNHTTNATYYNDKISRGTLESLRNGIVQSYVRAKNYGQQRGMRLKPAVDVEKQLSESKVTVGDLLDIVVNLSSSSNLKFDYGQNMVQENIRQSVKNQFSSLHNTARQSIGRLDARSFDRLYIPILRGLRPIYRNIELKKFTNEDAYLDRTTHDYFNSGNQTGKIYTGITIYDDVMRLLLGQEEDRKLIADFEKFLSENIFDKRVTLIPKYKEDVLHIKLGNDPQFEIYNLGDGLQTLIAILFPIYMQNDKSALVFIEEPESHLHPKWQKLLVNALSQFPQHQFFVSTHSASFINSENTAAFQVLKKNNTTVIKGARLDKDRLEILDDLGYKASDLLQTNYVLWVEGPSDKIYIEYWISRVAPHLIEGIHYSIVYFGGDNYKSFLRGESGFTLNIIKNVNQNFGIVLDSDKKGKYLKYKKEKKEIQALFEGNGHYCWLTKYREIENYLPIEIFKEAVMEVCKNQEIEIADGDYDDRNTVVDNKGPVSYRSTIKLSSDFFTTIQKNKDGTTNNITDEDLRTEVNEAIQRTAKKTFKTDKIKIAKAIVKKNPNLIVKELNEELKSMVSLIEKANS